jgi:hypothetical protein
MISLKYVNPISAAVCLLLSFVITPAKSQAVYGCRDPYANNYNPSATVNDGSCTYNATSYTPPVRADSISKTLVESSGLQWAGNSLWSFNDGGGAAAIYRIDTLSDALLQTVNLEGATNVDWEDIAFDGTNFYVGDFGNNANGARTDLKIYRFPLSAIPDYTTNPTVTIPAAQIKVINFIYSDQPRPIVDSPANRTRYDCEAMIVDGGKIHLFTKNWVDTTSTHYVIADTAAGTYTALPLETLATKYLVTGADKVPGQNIVALLGYVNYGFGNHFMHLLSDFSGGLYFNGNKRRIDLPDASVMGQAEGITFRNSTYGYISNEYFTRGTAPFIVTVKQKLRSFNTNNFVPSYVLPLGLKNFTASDIIGSHKISWQFAAPVQNLQLQQSSNGIDFTTLKSYNNSVSDIFYAKQTGAVTYYRLAWHTANGAMEYSNTISVKTGNNKGLRVHSLKADGGLKFTLDGTEASNYSFKLISTDGKVLSYLDANAYSPGLNSVHLPKNIIAGSFAYLVMESNSAKQTILLQVQK